MFPQMASFNESLEFLSESERIRYFQYRFSNKRLEFYYGRWLLKTVLSNYLKKKPEDIHFVKNSHGKLYVDKKLMNNDKKNLYFNLSHSKGIVVCALTLNREIGVDVEKVDKDITKSIHLWMTPQEIAYLDKQKRDERNTVAYRLWTMKEAFVKAKGKCFDLAPKFINVLCNDSVFFYSSNINEKYWITVAVETNKVRDKEFRIQEFNMCDYV